METTRMLLGRRPRDASERAEIRSPWDRRVVSVVAQATRADADEAAAAAERAAGAMARTTTFERRQVLEDVSRGLAARKEAFARAISDEAGKPITLALGEVARAVETFHLMAGETERLGGTMVPVDLSPATRGYRCLVRRFPRGPVLAIGPFNFPLNLLAHKIAPAIAVGAPVVVKPPPQAPSAALLLGNLVAELAPPSWPDGFLSVLPCSNEVAERLVTDDRFRVVSFTGSAPVGWRIKTLARKAHVVLELGGDAAVVVCEDADLDSVAKRIAYGSNAYAGQVCIGVQRVFVDERIRSRLTPRLVEATKAIATGDPAHPSTIAGPLIDDRAAERLETTAHESGRVLVGGTRAGRLMAPTLVDSPENSAAIAREEAFGPVAAVWGFEKFEDALARVNASRYGLQAGLFTHDVRRIFQAFDALRVGGLVVDDVPTLRVDSYPYGGTKDSGIGREGGPGAIDEYTEPRVMLLNTGSATV